MHLYYFLGFFILMMISMPFKGIASTKEQEHFNSVFMIEVKRESGTYICTGVAVSKKIILTAAHCLDGDVISLSFSSSTSKIKNIPVKEFMIHPKYNSKISYYRYDLGKIILEKELDRLVTIYPITELTGDWPKITRIGFGGRYSGNLKTLMFPFLREIKLDEHAVELYDQFSKPGDSGGPIFLHGESGLSLVAIHSTLSFGPQGTYSINPLLIDELDWIMAE